MIAPIQGNRNLPVTWNIDTRTDKIHLYEYRTEKDGGTSLILSTRKEANAIYKNIEITLNTIVGNYVFIHSSIINVFKYLESVSDTISDLLIDLRTGDKPRHYIIDIQSLLSSEDIIFLDDGMLYNTKKMKLISA